MKFLISIVLISLMGCASGYTPPPLTPATESSEAEYGSYLVSGTSTFSGQAFLTQVSGGVIKGAGRQVTLDPATSTGTDWWNNAGRYWGYRTVIPNSVNFIKARRVTTADAEGRFVFKNIPAGMYYVRTEVTWVISDYSTQGGVVGRLVEISERSVNEVILSSLAE